MKPLHVFAALALALAACATAPVSEEVARWEAQAANVTITRDDWGIAHVHGKTDADAVFGMVYAQAEDDFNRIETNFLNSQGRLAEAEGDSMIWQDLRMRLFIDPDTMKALYAQSPEWLKSLMNAWADGLNYYLHTHPEEKPRALTRFEPWMALTFSEGSIGGDIESSVNVRALRAFYEDSTAVAQPASSGADAGDGEPRGSNGIAIGPSNTTGGHALLLINPHTSFFFRSELQMSSDEGLNAYGAVTWGQFFVYQGFNPSAGWMHTSSGVDNTDEYLETIVHRGDSLYYKYGKELRPVVTSRISLPYKTADGMATREVTVYRTHHGPIVRKTRDGRWVSISLMNTPLKALTQSYSRTKATNLQEFRETMELHTNSSNNTLYADKSGNFAYLHANFIPRRSTRFDWSKPVDGSDPATDWNGIHSFDEAPNVINPPNGWVYNSNNWPYSAAGPDNSPKPSAYAHYTDEGTESFRGIHAMRVLTGRKDFTLDGLVAAAYDSFLPAFDSLIPPLIKSYDQLPASDPVKTKVTEQMELLRAWDRRWNVQSVETSLAIAWAEELARSANGARRGTMSVDEYMATRATAEERLRALAAASDTLVARYGAWKTPWGDINRFQRISSAIVHPFDDSKPSIPVGFTSARWGSLASFGARIPRGQKKLYGTSGNSFVAVVEFGDSVRARAITAGGESGHVDSPHFNDQAERYAKGDLREVYFYPSQLAGHTEKVYKPGR
jgi:acyl-homoserine-lactone acylase